MIFFMFWIIIIIIFVFFICLHYFSSSKKMQSHAVEKWTTTLFNCWAKTTSGSNLETIITRNECHLRFIIYADLKCVLQKMEPERETQEEYQEHDVFSTEYYVRCSYDDELSSYRFIAMKTIAWLVTTRKLDSLHEKYHIC